MMRLTAIRQRAVVSGLIVFVSLVLALPISGQGATAQAQVAEDSVQKTADLERARLNTGISADRLIVVYSAATASPTDPARQRIRQQVGGQLLRADSDIPRDVLRVPNGNAA